MQKKSNITYESQEICFQCCSRSKELPPIKHIDQLIKIQNAPDGKDNKISLRKYHQSHFKATEHKKFPPIPSLIQETSPKSARVFANFENVDKYIEPVRPLTSYQYVNKTSYCTNENRFSIGDQFIKTPDSRLLAKTTKIQRIFPSLPIDQEQLKKTRKNNNFHKINKLSQLKESVCSFNESSHSRQRLQESQVLLDYFNPSQDKLSQIEAYMKIKNMRRTQSKYMNQNANK